MTTTDPGVGTARAAEAQGRWGSGTGDPNRAGVLGGSALGVVMLVLALVVALSGSPAAPAPAPVATAGTGATQSVEVTLNGMTISPAVVEVPVGTHLVLEVTNADAMRHDLVLAGGPATPMLGPGESATLDVGPVEAGIEGWCSVPGHRAAGMTMSIVVTGTGGATGAAATGDDAATTRAMPGPHHGAADPHHGALPGGLSPGAAADLDPTAAPGADWRPYDPTLEPAPGATEHELTLRVEDAVVEVAPGVRQTLWTFNGTAPGPTLRGKVGDLFTITFVNDATTGHGIDFHAGSLAPDEPMRTIAPGESLTYQFVAERSGAWLYHCSTPPMSLHIANGMFGAVIIDPPDLPEVDTELVLVSSELYLGEQDGVADEAKIAAERPDATAFNGYVDQYVHAPVGVDVGERVRVWVVAAGPQRGVAFHVVGTQFDTVFKEGAYLLRPDNPERGGSQVLDLAAAQGGFVELVLPEPGHYPFVDHAMVDAERGARGILVAR